MDLVIIYSQIIPVKAFAHLVNIIKCSLHAVVIHALVTVHPAMMAKLVINAKMDLIMIWKIVNAIGSARIKKELIGIIRL